MVTKEEIERVMRWCDKTKKEKKKIYIIERNPFRDEIAWMRRFPLIEIDRPKEVAAKTNLVYDSLTKTLWQYYMNQWRKVEPAVEIKYE